MGSDSAPPARLGARPARAVRHAAWAKRPWHGRVDGEALDSAVSIIFFQTDTVGEGPGLHVHPYDEIFIVRQGRAEFTIGEEVIVGEEGDVLMGPAQVPHKYRNLGPGPLGTSDIHMSATIIQTDLDDPAGA